MYINHVPGSEITGGKAMKSIFIEVLIANGCRGSGHQGREI